MEGIKFGLKISLFCVRRALARHLLLPLGVVAFVAGVACHAAPLIIESHSWKGSAGAGLRPNPPQESYGLDASVP